MEPAGRLVFGNSMRSSRRVVAVGVLLGWLGSAMFAADTELPPPEFKVPPPKPDLSLKGATTTRTKIVPPAPKASAAAHIPTSEIVSDSTAAAVENSVVRIFVTLRRPDPTKPWTKQAPVESAGTGIVVEGKRILTNAHVVTYASEVQVQGNQSGAKISATVDVIAPGIDLATLKLEDESFFANRPPIPRANVLPNVKDPVLAYGYPAGGTSLSITKGIVSRIEFAPYQATVSGLRIQTDAPLNPGNSGGPAISADKMIGLAFSKLVALPGATPAQPGATPQNIGYIIPNEEIELFLKDAADGRYDGKPAIFEELQTLENPALRAFLKVAPTVHGVVVTEPYSAAADYPLKKLDVVTQIGDTAIEDDGMVRLERMPRVAFPYLVAKTARNGKVPLRIVRHGQEQTIELPVLTERPMVIPDHPGTYPSYFIFGPMVFSNATGLFATMLSTNPITATLLGAIGNPLVVRRGDKPAFEGEGLVVVPAPFFPHKLAKGYTNPIGRVVETVNGQKIKNLKHLVEIIRTTNEPFVAIEFAGHGAPTIVLPREECLAATEDILSDNSIRSQGSADVLSVWHPQTGR